MSDDTPRGVSAPGSSGHRRQPSPEEIEQARREALRIKMTNRPLGASGSIAKAFLESKLTPLIVVFSLLLGAFAVLVTPREEEPQIKVPMIDVMVGYPGATAEEVEHRVATPLEKLLYEIDNVDYIYSISQPSGTLIIVRFLVGTDPDQAAVRVHSKIAAAMDTMPAGMTPPVVKPRTIDDVPVAAFTLWSERADTTELRKVADEIKVELTRHPASPRSRCSAASARWSGSTSTASASPASTSRSSRPTRPSRASTGGSRPGSPPPRTARSRSTSASS